MSEIIVHDKNERRMIVWKVHLILSFFFWRICGKILFRLNNTLKLSEMDSFGFFRSSIIMLYPGKDLILL